LPLNYRSQKISGWGRYPVSRASIARPERRFEVVEALRQLKETPSGSVIARGSGLAYGDAALNAGGRVIAMSRLNRFLDFDAANGIVSCEAGVTLGEILDLCMPHGWFLAVTPGTARATAGGCLACDVHGKNHHRAGSFSQYVISATILLGNGELKTCTPNHESELFWATAGGMGLTGTVLDLTLRLQRIETAYIRARNIACRDLDATFRGLEETADATYLAAWLDGVARGSRFGRGVLMLGEHATLDEFPAQQGASPVVARTRRPRSLPFSFPFPSVFINRPLTLAFNAAIFHRYAADTGPHFIGAREYMYPLDAFDNWNRLFGARGFLEYQVVLPPQQAFDGIKRMLEMTHRAGVASFFTALKRLGGNAPAQLSFPMPGYAFSLSVPAGNQKALSLLDLCDEVTIELGGRVYLAKDARLRASSLAAMYPRLGEWRAIARRHDSAGVFASDMSRRLELAS
jgi:decaprenylphospho-beta-D-ribofuranose 2-oxidase